MFARELQGDAYVVDTLRAIPPLVVCSLYYWACEALLELGVRVRLAVDMPGLWCKPVRFC